MTSLLDKFVNWKNGYVIKNTTETIQKLFRTDINEQQLAIIDKINWEQEQKTKIVIMLALLLYLFAGIIMDLIIGLAVIRG